MSMTSELDTEIEVMSLVGAALDRLEPDAQHRVIDWISKRLGITGIATTRVDEPAQTSSTDSTASAASSFGYFAELFDAASPGSSEEKVLVAAYWVQVCQGADSFMSLALNKELKNLGHPADHISQLLDHLIEQKPSLVIQLKKAGSSQQAKKTYKVTIEGIRTVQRMLSSKET